MIYPSNLLQQSLSFSSCSKTFSLHLNRDFTKERCRPLSSYNIIDHPYLLLRFLLDFCPV
jgi:hypothetical protein